MSSDINYSDDQSLQRWGRNLSGAAPAAAEVEAAYRRAEELKNQFQTVFGKIREQGESALPASDRLVSEIDSVHNRAAQASTAAAWRSVVADAETLPTIYQREHETDEDRVNAPRRSLQAEQRADVRAASQDT